MYKPASASGSHRRSLTDFGLVLPCPKPIGLTYTFKTSVSKWAARHDLQENIKVNKKEHVLHESYVVEFV